MSAITPYTTTTQVRGALGLTDNEVTEPMLGDQGLDLALYVELGSWYPAHAADWAAYQVTTASEAETLKGRLLILYSTWFCASLVSEMWMAIPQRISDGKTDMRRFSTLDLKALVKNAKARAAKYKADLLDIEDPNRTAAYGQAGLASPSYDPVTGEST